MSTNADRELLFGLLALQNDFVTSDALVAAFGAWVADKGRGIGAMLVERGALKESRRVALDLLVDEHVAVHGDDPAASLAALSSVDETALREIGQIGDESLAQSLASIPATVTSSGGADRTATYEAAGPDGGGRFRVLRFHARGGLGQVSVALDRELNREVAYKEILPEREGESGNRDRFMLEGEVTGGLEHPGIVPVYSLGTEPRTGRPFYAMRLIRGENLDRAIARFHSAGKTDYNSVAFRDLLGRFLDVCDAISYAHNRGVLHRDIKPGNIMLGRYGETLVVDWGLARLSGGGEGAATEEPPLSASSGSSLGTVAGSAMGTPGYMSPEQAEGRLDLLGPATDVYALGATLYPLLTGQAAIADHDRDVRLERTRRGDIPRPRLVRAEVPKALEAVCLKAMALRPEDRYASVRQLGDDLKRWLADEPVSSYREPVSTRAWRWVRRHRTAATAAASVVLMGLIGLGIAYRMQTAYGERMAEANATINGKNTELARANGDLQVANQQLEVARAEAVRERDQSDAVTEFLVDSFASPDPARDGRTITIAEVLDRAIAGLSNRADLKPEAKTAIEDAIARSYQGLGLPDDAAKVLEPARDDRAQRLGPDDPATLRAQGNLAVAYEAMGRLSEALELYEATLAANRTTHGPDSPEALNSQNNLAYAYQKAGRGEEALALIETTVEASRAKLGPEHPATLRAEGNLAVAYEALGRLEDALPLYESVLKARRVALGPDNPETLVSQNNLAYAYERRGRTAEALALYEATVQSCRAKLGPDHFETLVAQSNLATAYFAAGRQEAAVPLLESTLKAQRAKLGDDHPDVLMSRLNMGVAYQRTGRLKEAVDLLESTLEASRAKLGAEHPTTLIAQGNLASAYEDSGRRLEALRLLEATLEVRRRKLEPGHPDRLLSQYNLAVMYKKAGKLARALDLFEPTLSEYRKSLGPDHPETVRTQEELASAYEKAGRLAEAAELYEATLAAKRARSGPDDPKTVVTQNSLAVTYLSARRFEKAVPLLEATLEAKRALQGADHFDTLTTQNNLAYAYLGAKRYDEAIALFEVTLGALKAQLGPSNPYFQQARLNLAGAYRAAGRLAEALPLFEAARSEAEGLTVRHPRLREIRQSLADCYRRMGRIAEAKEVEQRILAEGGKVERVSIPFPADVFGQP